MGEASTPVLEPVRVDKPERVKTWREGSIVDFLGISDGEVFALDNQVRMLARNGSKPDVGFAYNIYSVIAQNGKVKVTPAQVYQFYDGLIG